MGLSFSTRKFVQGTISVTDHSGLTGLGDDDHDIYAKADGSREWGISGSFNSHRVATTDVHGAGTGTILHTAGTIDGSIVPILTRRGSADTWEASDPILFNGEIGVETDTGLIKIGDGTTSWTSLSYAQSVDTGVAPYGRDLQGACGSFNPVDGTMYFFGGLPAQPAGTAKGRYTLPVLADSWLKRAAVIFYTGGTGSNEVGTVIVQHNGSYDYIVSGSARQNNTIFRVSNYTLNAPCLKGDYLEFKWITPAWATNPTDVRISGFLSFDSCAAGGLGTSRPSGTQYYPGTSESGDEGSPDEGSPDNDIDPSKYGTAAYTGGEPIGGGTGYSSYITSGDFTVTTQNGIENAIGSAGSGDVIYIPGTCDIQLDGYITVDKSYITIASNRSAGSGSPGAIIRREYGVNNIFYVSGDHVTLKGLRLAGPDADGRTDSSTGRRGVTGNHGFIVENCEIWNHGDSGVAIYADSVGGLYSGTAFKHGISKVLFCYLHDCCASGCGYGVGCGKSTLLVEGCRFKNYRHGISGARNTDSGQTADENVFAEVRYCRFESSGLANGPAAIDQHGGNDNSAWSWSSGPAAWSKAGAIWRIHHNKFEGKTFPSVQIRGVPSYYVDCYYNWTYWSSSSSKSAFKQVVSNLGLTAYQKMTVENNWYGTANPPSSS